MWYKFDNVRVRMNMYACMCMWKPNRAKFSQASQELAKGGVVGRVQKSTILLKTCLKISYSGCDIE
jgi:hypothetical protein